MEPNSQTPAPSRKKSNKRTWLMIIILLLIIGAVAAYFINKNNNDKNSSTTASTQPANQPKSSATNTFAPVSTTGQPFVATISTNAGGQQTTATMTTDGKGNVSYAYQKNGQTTTLTYTADAYYLCSGTSQCIKYPVSQSANSGFDPSTYLYDSTKINSLKDTAAYKGQQSCPAGSGTCDVWSVTNGGTTSTVYINTSSKRIVKASTASGTTTSDVTYDYKNVTVAIPTNAVTLPTQ